MKALETGTTLATVFTAASLVFVLTLLTVGVVVAGVAGLGCW